MSSFYLDGVQNMRVGLGYDLHQLVKDRPLIIGGVNVPYDRGLLGHSDGDVLAHAIIDALFGAAALGNIGTHFPDTDASFKDADSMTLLVEATKIVANEGYAISNVDATVIAEQPKLNPHVEAMRAGLASAMGLEIGQVSVKPKTNESVGPEGRGEAISVHAIVLLAER